MENAKRIMESKKLAGQNQFSKWVKFVLNHPNRSVYSGEEAWGRKRPESLWATNSTVIQSFV